MKLTKNGVTYDVADKTQIDAFVSAGWSDGKTPAKSEVTKKAFDAMRVERDAAIAALETEKAYLATATDRIFELETDFAAAKDRVFALEAELENLKQGGK